MGDFLLRKLAIYLYECLLLVDEDILGKLSVNIRLCFIILGNNIFSIRRLFSTIHSLGYGYNKSCFYDYIHSIRFGRQK